MSVHDAALNVLAGSGVQQAKQLYIVGATLNEHCIDLDVINIPSVTT